MIGYDVTNFLALVRIKNLRLFIGAVMRLIFSLLVLSLVGVFNTGCKSDVTTTNQPSPRAANSTQRPGGGKIPVVVHRPHVVGNDTAADGAHSN